jgi:hypothetical protein
MSFDKIIDVYDRQPVVPSERLRNRAPQKTVLASAYELIDSANETLPTERHISYKNVAQIVDREKGNTPAAIERIILNYISTVENPRTATPTHHVDLLPQGHPLSPAEGKTPEAVAAYFSSDPYFKDDSVRTLVASAIMSNPESASRKFITSQLSVRDPHGYYVDAIAYADTSLGRN